MTLGFLSLVYVFSFRKLAFLYIVSAELKGGLKEKGCEQMTQRSL